MPTFSFLRLAGREVEGVEGVKQAWVGMQEVVQGEGMEAAGAQRVDWVPYACMLGRKPRFPFV